MIDSRYPWLVAVPERYARDAERIAAAIDRRVCWHKDRHSLWFWRGDVTTGCSHEEVMRRADGTFRALDSGVEAVIRKAVWHNGLPLEEKQRLVEEHRARERAKKDERLRRHLEDVLPEARMDTRRQLGRRVVPVKG